MESTQFPSNEQNHYHCQSILILTVGQHALLHWETLFVVSSGNAEHVSLPFVSEMVGFYFSADALLVEHTQFVVIDHFKCFLGSRGRE